MYNVTSSRLRWAFLQFSFISRFFLSHRICTVSVPRTVHTLWPWLINTTIKNDLCWSLILHGEANGLIEYLALLVSKHFSSCGISLIFIIIGKVITAFLYHVPVGAWNRRCFHYTSSFNCHDNINIFIWHVLFFCYSSVRKDNHDNFILSLCSTYVPLSYSIHSPFHILNFKV